MEINQSYGSVPTSQEDSIYAQEDDSAEQLRIDFLKMLTAQLEYQDPMDPVENTEFTAQMAQFSSLGEQQKGNELLEQLVAAQNGGQLNDVVSYIGKKAVFAGDHAIASNGKVETRFNMESAGVADIKLYDESGQFVTSSSQAFNKGDQSFTFEDESLADGSYKFAVSIRGEDDSSIAAKTYEAGEVTGAINGSSGVQVEVNGKTISLADIHRVEQITS